MKRRLHYVPSTRTVWVALLVAALAVIALLLWLILRVASLSQQLDDAGARQDDLTVRAQENAAAAGALERQVRRLGEQPVVETDDLAEPPRQGPQGRPPTASEIARAVALYCASGACRGQDGADVTPAIVAAAVAGYCDDRGRCRGPSGRTGQDGSAGTPGRAGDDGIPGGQGPQGAAGQPGQDGTTPTAEQIATAVADYCSTRGQCRGNTGAAGPRGEPGPQGPPGPAGVDSTVPGPQGPQGEAGPTCPQGYTGRELTVRTRGTVLDGEAIIFACVRS